MPSYVSYTSGPPQLPLCLHELRLLDTKSPVRVWEDVWRELDCLPIRPPCARNTFTWLRAFEATLPRARRVHPCIKLWFRSFSDAMEERPRPNNDDALASPLAAEVVDALTQPCGAVREPKMDVDDYALASPLAAEVVDALTQLYGAVRERRINGMLTQVAAQTACSVRIRALHYRLPVLTELKLINARHAAVKGEMKQQSPEKRIRDIVQHPSFAELRVCGRARRLAERRVARGEQEVLSITIDDPIARLRVVPLAAVLLDHVLVRQLPLCGRWEADGRRFVLDEPLVLDVRRQGEAYGHSQEMLWVEPPPIHMDYEVLHVSEPLRVVWDELAWACDRAGIAVLPGAAARVPLHPSLYTARNPLRWLTRANSRFSPHGDSATVLHHLMPVFHTRWWINTLGGQNLLHKRLEERKKREKRDKCIETLPSVVPLDDLIVEGGRASLGSDASATRTALIDTM